MLEFVGRRSEPTEFRYTWKDVVLYALSVGAQAEELSFIYENAPGGLKVIPSFCVLPCFDAFVRLLSGIKIDLTRILHGEHRVLLHSSIPPEGVLWTTGEIADVYDKGPGKAALIVVRMTTTSEEDGDPLFENEFVIFYRGMGGFGGKPGPRSQPLTPPEGREPDFRVAYQIPDNQAALYRLNGDRNPLHIDPQFARMAGFQKPILHGLCSFGYATRAIVHKACGGDVGLLREFKVRFTDVVYPGETLITEGWKEDGRYLIRVLTERAPVMTHSYAVVGP